MVTEQTWPRAALRPYTTLCAPRERRVGMSRQKSPAGGGGGGGAKDHDQGSSSDGVAKKAKAPWAAGHLPVAQITSHVLVAAVAAIAAAIVTSVRSGRGAPTSGGLVSDERLCQLRLHDGLCTSSPAMMRKYCPQTVCHGRATMDRKHNVTRPPSMDTHAQCSTWAVSGWCDTKPEVPTQCPTSCSAERDEAVPLDVLNVLYSDYKGPDAPQRLDFKRHEDFFQFIGGIGKGSFRDIYFEARLLCNSRIVQCHRSPRAVLANGCASRTPSPLTRLRLCSSSPS